jgi:hypothetical protein
MEFQPGEQRPPGAGSAIAARNKTVLFSDQKSHAGLG